MDNPLITIIVPVYKVEPYLRKCVDSILAQTYTNIEVILVDDGSPDGCPAICDEYKEKDSRVVVIHQKNGGVSAARNAGLDIAKGEYIGFVDSDDWIEPDMYEVLMDIVSKTGSDIVISTFCEDEYQVNSCEKQNIISFSSDEAVRGLFFGDNNLCFVCGKIFNSKIFVNVRFPSGVSIAEDTIVSLKTIIKSDSISYIDYKSYHYVTNSYSAMHMFRETFWSIQTANDILVDMICEYDNRITYCAEKRSIEADIALAIFATDSGKFTKKAYIKVTDHISKYKNKESCSILRKNIKCWLKLMEFGRIPFIFGRKMYSFFFGGR